MTTITLTGIQIDYVNDSVGAVGEAEAKLTMPSKNDTFSYTTYGTEPFPDVDITETLSQVILNGQLADNIEAQFGNIITALGTVTWSGGTTTALAVSWATGANSDTDLIFVLDGAALPPINQPSDWEAFDASITSASSASGAFAPGMDIKWTEFDNFTLTENDDFVGTAGKNRFDGGIGDDIFRSSNGQDIYLGGKGFDLVTYESDPGAVNVNLANQTATDGWGKTDTLKAIEMVLGSAFNDTLVGSGGRNHFLGLDGDDIINGAKGRDLVRYDGDATFGGTAGVNVNLKNGTAIDGFGSTDTLRNIEDARGTGAADVLKGNGGKNTLEGNGGNDKIFGLGGVDVLIGGNGRDRLDGGNGDDNLYGGAKADRFIFRGNFGNDTIFDFQTKGKAEKVDLSHVGSITGFADLTANHLTEVNGNAVIDDGNGHTITFDGIAMAELSGNDFLF